MQLPAMEQLLSTYGSDELQTAHACACLTSVQDDETMRQARTHACTRMHTHTHTHTHTCALEADYEHMHVMHSCRQMCAVLCESDVPWGKRGSRAARASLKPRGSAARMDWGAAASSSMLLNSLTNSSTTS